MIFSGNRKQSDTTYPMEFMLISSSDHITGLTGKAGSVTVSLSKNGGAGGVPSGAISEVDATNQPGLYKIAGNATDSNTLGPLFLHAKDAASDPWDSRFDIVTNDPFTFKPPVTLAAADQSGTLNVNAASVGGTAQTGLDLGAQIGTAGAGLTALPKRPMSLALSDFTGGNIPADIQTIKTQAVTCATGVTVPTSIASPTNITAASGVALAASQHVIVDSGTVTTVSGNVNGSVNSVTTGVTVTTNNDKNNYTLSAASILAIWNQLTTDAGIIASSFALKLKNWTLGTDNKSLVSTDAQNLSATFRVDAKVVDGTVTLAASQPNYAPSKAGDAMTLTAPYDAAKTAASQASVSLIPTAPLLAVNYTAPPSASSIATAVWAAGGRTLSSFGTLVADVATAVWGATIRALTDKSGYTLDASQRVKLDASQPDYAPAKASDLAVTVYPTLTTAEHYQLMSIPTEGIEPIIDTAAIASAVADLQLAGHLSDGSLGKAISNASSWGVDYDLLAAAVLDAEYATHDTVDTIGWKLNAEGTPLVIPLIPGASSAINLTKQSTLTLMRGDTYRLVFSLGRDCTGWTALFGAKKDPTKSIYDIAARSATYVDQTAGTGYVDLSAVDTAIVGTFYAEIELTNGALVNTPERYLIIITQDVIR